MKIRSLFCIFGLSLIVSCAQNSKDKISNSFFLAISNYSEENICLELNNNKEDIININKQTAKIYQIPKSKLKNLEEQGIDLKLYIDDEVIDSKKLRLENEITSYSAYGGYQAGINIISNDARGTIEIEVSTTFCDYDHGDIKFIE